ncbi:hypothetical protein EUX98_g3704 [Antrodiella citrinella]|uniref:Uncharacterized protein n=1 Tax=Antrodiella citrinella TaxID=2447956 RepID=A0A4S4MYD6_9APHY|nr:hypothetical protein EUX98_g3704 [Antrodiella citrinella]
MPSSTVSLEPLSSPSPSPPPPELTIRDSHSNHSGAAAGLDSGSELSELTDDDQENDNAEDEDERPRPTRRKKRGGIVPAPMWDWAYKKADSGWRNKLIEEEEEEEQAGPAEAMEEEEDEGNDEDGTVDGDSPQMRPNLPLPDAPEDKEDEPEEDDVPEDEDDVPEGEDDQPTVHALNNLDHDADPASDDDEAEPAVGTASRDTPPPRPAARLTSPELSDDENVDDEPVNTDAGIGEDEGQDAEPAADSDDEAEPNKPIPNGASTRQTPAPATASTTKVTTTTTVVTITKNPEPDASATPMDVDEDTPAPVVSPVAVVAAQSSLMAGADVVAPVSPSSASSSASGSPRGSPSPSRSPSAEPASDHEVDAKTTNGRMSIKAKATVSKVQNTRLTRTRSRRRTKGNTGFDQDEDTGRLGGEDDRDLADGDDVDIDSPDMELESDVLPVHRAEALDVLAQIELKFALLREKLYVEKMEGLAWEEALIAEGAYIRSLKLTRC